MATEDNKDEIVTKIAEIERIVEAAHQEQPDEGTKPAPQPAEPPLRDQDAVAEKYRAAGYDVKSEPGAPGVPASITVRKSRPADGPYYASGQRSVFNTPEPATPEPTQFPEVMPCSTAADGTSPGVKRHEPLTSEEWNRRLGVGGGGDSSLAGFKKINDGDLSSDCCLPELTPLEHRLYILALNSQGDAERQKLFAAGGVKACKTAALEHMREMIKELQPKKKPWYKFW